jgi:hypothetical protein
MNDPEDKQGEAGATHGESGAPTDAAHREAGDGTLQGSVPAGGLGDQDGEDKTAEPGTG